jgi:hypothetical protein
MWIGSHQPQEEEVFTSQTLRQGQGQGQGLEVEMSSIACFLVVCCRRRSNNKAPCLVSDISEPVHWKWKKKNVGLSSVKSELKLSTLQGFYAVDRDFLRLPQLMKTFLQS